MRPMTKDVRALGVVSARTVASTGLVRKGRVKVDEGLVVEELASWRRMACFLDLSDKFW